MGDLEGLGGIIGGPWGWGGGLWRCLAGTGSSIAGDATTVRPLPRRSHGRRGWTRPPLRPRLLLGGVLDQELLLLLSKPSIPKPGRWANRNGFWLYISASSSILSTLSSASMGSVAPIFCVTTYMGTKRPSTQAARMMNKACRTQSMHTNTPICHKVFCLSSIKPMNSIRTS